ncbi:protein of unknown function [Tissierella praeacuta DSM 18095]|uniref:DUF4367 domain-containing protein n=1 Tax=Tissierella praeacuta DSM 18095 TaxID=1123404 RepID=A0A1M4ZVR9_9FIRM|nr:DUF4367 domain-containing protein [Tissierella praeacuta]TCU64356.1 uncharacterized protein DUF4367 [Tissierella praeacuta]SHF22091.1 protein of unknown function [Tissierella praeacuta DSM 18095]SUP02231.1 Uncharacterised protein [Tissierella praeacuta]
MNKYVMDDDFLYKYVKSAENIMIDSLPKEEALSHNFSKRFQKKMNKLIRQERRSPFIKIFVNYSRKVAIIFLIFISIAFATTMSVEAYRVRFFEVVIEVWEEFTSIIFKEKQNIDDGKLIPVNSTYIPDSFKIIEHEINSYEQFIYWQNDEGIEIMFEQAKITANSIITDTEGIDIEELLIGEQKIIYFTNKNVNQIYWNDSNYIYAIISEYDKNELLKMVESIINNK